MLTTLAAMLLLGHQASDGRIAFVSDRDGNEEIYVMNADGTETKRLTFSPGRDIQPCFSPDGLHIAFASNRTGDWDIWSMDVDGTNLKNLTANKDRQETNPMWSDDPNVIGLVSNRRFYSVNPNGEGLVQLMDYQLVQNCQPAMTRSGLKFVFREPDGHLKMKQGWDYNVMLEITYGISGVPKEAFNPSWTNDASEIAFDSGGATPKLFVAEVEDNSCDQVIFEGNGMDPVFAKQNDALVFTMPVGEGKGSDIGIIDIDAVHKTNTPKPKNLTHTSGNDSQPCYWEMYDGGQSSFFGK